MAFFPANRALEGRWLRLRDENASEPRTTKGNPVQTSIFRGSGTISIYTQTSKRITWIYRQCPSEPRGDPYCTFISSQPNGCVGAVTLSPRAVLPKPTPLGLIAPFLAGATASPVSYRSRCFTPRYG
ncbi:hypothetical protein PUNSTDRAFT_118468 [Punctularia strigosozonata HHB-11173 SS5]|uniref:uncharacterized protein n=1 Tax=Punctularia strigosozonata (strain HHB-11173) TaxID=741275 RepID=UPI0004417081|nr:uncharacterized protein PUNSTDRAFT_118468 [Punctularia strigosozonata HHB-11173 SS5]EIN12759.1 hypothetical protein PUNSTDRAFT_118468 [Punctularia strigosozonata HHB-11173 SS5]